MEAGNIADEYPVQFTQLRGTVTLAPAKLSSRSKLVKRSNSRILSEKCFQSTSKLLLYPLVENGGAEAPDLADLQGTNLPSPCHPLESLGME
jgi:hypothetical protein